MIENMVLQGVGGGFGWEHPTSITAHFSTPRYYTLYGITKEPFLVIWAYTYTYNDTKRYSCIYLKGDTESRYANNAIWWSTQGSSSRTPITDVTYNASDQNLVIKTEAYLEFFPQMSQIWCFYTA